MKMPPSNFSQIGLARVFGFDTDDSTEIPSSAAHSKTAIIAGTVCGITGLAMVALGFYGFRLWRKRTAHPEEQWHEKDVVSDVHRVIVEPVELQANETSERPRREGPP